MHNHSKSIAHSHCDALFGHLANQQAINDQALVETTCKISSLVFVAFYKANEVVGEVLAVGEL